MCRRQKLVTSVLPSSLHTRQRITTAIHRVCLDGVAGMGRRSNTSTPLAATTRFLSTFTCGTDVGLASHWLASCSCWFHSRSICLSPLGSKQKPCYGWQKARKRRNKTYDTPWERYKMLLVIFMLSYSFASPSISFPPDQDWYRPGLANARTSLQSKIPPAPSLLRLGRVKRKAAESVVTGARMKASTEVSSKVRLGPRLVHPIACSVTRAPSLG